MIKTQSAKDEVRIRPNFRAFGLSSVIILVGNSVDYTVREQMLKVRNFLPELIKGATIRHTRKK